MTSTGCCLRTGLLSMLQDGACSVLRWFGGSMRQLAQLLGEVPTNQVAAAAGRWHPAACLGRRESIATYARAAVHACLACCPCDARSALMAVSLADRHHGAERPNRRPPRRMCFVWDVWARMGAKRHASRHMIRHGSLLPNTDVFARAFVSFVRTAAYRWV